MLPLFLSLSEAMTLYSYLESERGHSPRSYLVSEQHFDPRLIFLSLSETSTLTTILCLSEASTLNSIITKNGKTLKFEDLNDVGLPKTNVIYKNR